MDSSPELERRIAGVAALDLPLRRDLYRRLMTVDGWTSRDDAAAALAVPRSVAAFHLDKLAEAGVVEVRFERTSGRSGPGAGRPSKLYRPSAAEVTASVPERQYDLAGSLLATAIDESSRTGAPVAECLRVAAHALGRRSGDEVRDAVTERSSTERTSPADQRRALIGALAQRGYEPEVREGDEIVLVNCPFHRLAEQHRELVCGMNLDLLDGLLDGLDDGGQWTARLDPEPGWCCVRITRS